MPSLPHSLLSIIGPILSDKRHSLLRPLQKKRDSEALDAYFRKDISTMSDVRVNAEDYLAKESGDHKDFSERPASKSFLIDSILSTASRQSSQQCLHVGVERRTTIHKAESDDDSGSTEARNSPVDGGTF